MATLLVACINRTTLEEGNNYKLYQISEQRIFSLVYRNFSNIVTDTRIEELEGENRGFFAKMQHGVDWFTLEIRIVPADGYTLNGQLVKGYYVELDSGGSYPDKRALEVFDGVKRQLDESGSGIIVRSYEKSNYSLQPGKWRIADQSLSNDRSEAAADRLLQLKLLYDEGVLTKDEYDSKKAELLEQL